MEAIILALFTATAAALPAGQTPPAIPISYAYGNYPRIEAKLKWGTPAQQHVPTIFDTGSVGFWVFGPNATINDGSQYHYTPGPCNKSVHNFYDWPASSTHSELVHLNGTVSYAYGGNGKIVSANAVINDTFAFSETNWPALSDNQVALSNYQLVTQLDDQCAIPESKYDHSILGLAAFGVGGTTIAETGPSFRQNLYEQGRISSRSFSMWMDKAPNDVKGEYKGTALFGAVPKAKKYAGDLVKVDLAPPTDGGYIGYYVGTPQMTATSFGTPGAATVIKQSDTSVKQCLIDSGTGQDNLPFSLDQVLNVTGLIQVHEPAYFTAWNGTCDSIPHDATLNFTFAGATAGKQATVAVPIRSYARGQFDQIPGYDASKYCGLSLSLDEYGDCTFGAPFFTAAFLAFDDENKQIAIAQGGASTGADEGYASLGGSIPIIAGQGIPGSQ